MCRTAASSADISVNVQQKAPTVSDSVKRCSYTGRSCERAGCDAVLLYLVETDYSEDTLTSSLMARM